ncbi:MAG: folate-binding protein YgfZ [Rhodobacter sp.]|uniref:CAF17-like 4Fe-4S cluster assembly/insertion protein YgfZ n=1 Tax=Pararhodobacter sp. TaxID=2127056 RepID=UPI002BB33795|nr:folate-binding protein [Pararhodobacter sp.]MCC0073046.1 folate-binding protein YgfZ [Rhodobacter sp.]HPD92421.1 folate-binding protein [Pararhodobacter sp.]
MTETRCAPVPDRALLRVTGPDREKYLQGLVTQDMGRVLRDGIGYGALLTPQGKLIADFLLVAQPDAVLIDVARGLADDLARRLTMFRLRSRVEIARTDLPVTRGIGPAPRGALADPREPGLGWRLYGQALTQGAAVDWDALRIARKVPETGAELIPGDSFILELGFARLNGVDFRKGCYVGQEVTARMHHKTELRRGLVVLSLPAGPVPPGTPVLMADGREAGAVYTQADGKGLALMRMDRIEGPLSAGGQPVTPVD